jgi:hypothetical protein
MFLNRMIATKRRHLKLLPKGTPDPDGIAADTPTSHHCNRLFKSIH